MSLIENEQTKLTATWLNNIAVASVVAGAVSPIAAMLYGFANPQRGDTIVIALSFTWL